MDSQNCAIAVEAPTPAAEGIELRRLRAIFVGSVGNLVEWYDFYAYAAFSLYFQASFFPAQDPTAQAMSTAGIFALGFFVRPLGGLLFGHIGDRYGRRRALMTSVLLMCGGSLLIACTPGYAQVGALAPAILLVARLLQGLSVGGEYGSSATYLSEMATSRHRGFYSSFQYVTLIGGQLTALVVLLILQNFFLSPAELRQYGWRIPFLIGALLAFIALVMRRDLPETDVFEQLRQHTPNRLAGWKLLAQYPRQCLLVVGLTMGGTLTFYVYTTYMQKFLKLSVGLSDGQTTAVLAATLIFAMILQPLYGALSDRIGRKPMLLGFALIGTLATVPLMTAFRHAQVPVEAFILIACVWLILSGYTWRKPLLLGFALIGALATVPLMTAIRHAQGPVEAFIMIACAWLIVSGYTSINAVVKAELFPAVIRATGVGVPYAIAVSLFGGSAEYVALWFKQAGMENGFYWYTTVVLACTLLVYLGMRDTQKYSRIDEEAS